MTNLEKEWRDLQRVTSDKETAVLQQMAEVQRLRVALQAAIRRLETLIGPQ